MSYVGERIDKLLEAEPDGFKKIDEIMDDEVQQGDGYIQIWVVDELEYGTYHHYLFVRRDTMEVLDEIKFQHGPIGENGINGIQHAHMLGVVRHRLQAFVGNASPTVKGFTNYNAVTLACVNQGLLWDAARTKDRRRRMVEGTSDA